MIMPIAMARDGFIDINENPNFTQNDSFLECLQKIFNFENKDLQEFDGNTCRLINAYDPTNSIFIYTNQQGTFLYTITSATPYIHKNKMIWNCQTYKMEDLSKINEVCKDGESAQALIVKNIFPNLTSDNKPFSKVLVKDNFKTNEIVQSRLGANLCAFKIKCFVNPTGESLTNNSNDGSYNFFFPMLMFERITITGETETDITNAICLNEDLQTSESLLKLSDIISKYSQQIKSIEFIPFFPTTIAEMGGGISNIDRHNPTTLYLNTIGTAVYTDCGIFIPQGHYSTGYEYVLDLPNFFMPTQIIKGGGARGFLRTPLGNIQLDFELNKNENSITYFLKDDGWKIDGKFKCDVPPHYINFYTDNAGQVFIQNLTTNAQELRQLERENVAKYEEQQQNYVYGQFKNAIGTSSSVVSNLASGNLIGALGGALGGVMQAGNLAIENEFNKSKIERDYSRSLVEYKDKLQTQSLLASLTGKQVSGNVGLLEFLESFNCNFFKIFIELNYNLQYSGSNNYIIICQKDYDYSTTANPNPNNQTQAQLQNNKCLAVFDTVSTVNYNSNVAELLSQIFGYGTNQRIKFEDAIGLNYNIVFKLQNTIITGNETLNNLQYTNELIFPVRRKTKLNTY